MPPLPQPAAPPGAVGLMSRHLPSTSARRSEEHQGEVDMNRGGGLGIVGVIVVVLVILWLVGVIKL